MIELLKNPELWRLIIELLIIPLLLSGDQIGLIRMLNWLKEWLNLGGRKVLGFPLMRIVAGVAAVLAAGLVGFADQMFTGNLLDPQVFVGMVLAFFTLSQAWYEKIEDDIDLQKVSQ